MIKAIALLFLVSAVLTQPINYEWNCNVVKAELTVGVQMQPITCTINHSMTTRITPDLPAGLTYSITVSGSMNTLVISGTPKEGLNPRLFYIGYNAWVSAIEISVVDVPTKCSYGFDSMTLYTNIEMEPIPIQCNAAIADFKISPLLPEGMKIDSKTGTISGNLKVESTENIIYTVTATNPAPKAGSTRTEFTFRARSQSEMTTPGMIGCYWKTIAECRVPDFDFFYKNPAQLCQTVGDIHFTDNDVDNTWPGLDRRFVDYYSAYFYAYLNILSPSDYKFYLSSDDGAYLYIDDLSTPLISRESCRGKSEDFATKTLTTGRHLIVIRFFEYNAWSSMYVMYECSEASIAKQFVTSNLLRVGGRGPSFISYDFASGYVNTDMPVTMPQLSSGAPTNWSIKPALPLGVSINRLNGYISGRPSVSSSEIYTVTATGVNGEASAPLRVVITATPMNGFRTKYFKITDYDMCLYNMLTGNTIVLSQVKITDNINHPLGASNYIWPEAPFDFNSFFYMEWEGYLRMDKIGNWRLRITCSSGCKLIGADEQSLINNWGCHSMQASDTTFPVSKSGYYYFRVEYQQHTPSKGMILEWQAPGSFWEVVPANKIFFVPRGVLTYRSERTHYFQNIAITENMPILFSVNSLVNYVVFPELPSGIMLEKANGRISGTPTSTQIMTFYTITATNGPVSEKAVIGFDVTSVAAPVGLTYMYKGSAVTPATPIVIVPLITITPFIVLNPSGSLVNSYSVQPDLPRGLVLDSTTGTISGMARQTTAVAIYSVMVENSAGTLVLPINLEISGCKGADWTGNFVHVTFLSGSGSVEVVNSANALQMCSINIMEANGNAAITSCTASLNPNSNVATICLNPSIATGFNLRARCTSPDGCRWQVSREDGNFLPYRLAYTPGSSQPYTDSMPYPISLSPLTGVTLSSTEITAYAGNRIETVSVVPNGPYKSITITPSMGGVTIDPTYPLLSGIASGTGVVNYIILVAGSVGSAQATLKVTYAECSAASGKRAITIVKTTLSSGDQESWSLMKGTETIYSSGPLLSNLIYSNTFCLAPSNYVFKLMDSASNGWPSGSNIVVYDDNDNTLQTITFTGYMGSINVDFVLPTLNAVIQWKAWLSGKPDKNWNQHDFDSSSWRTIESSGNLGQWVQNGIFFVHKFSITDSTAYPIVEFGVYYKDGAIVYLNGFEVYRRNMQTGSVNYQTAASSTFDGFYLRQGTAAGYLLREGDNVLAIELHRLSGVSGTIDWSGYVSYEPGACVVRSLGGTVTESDFYDKFRETAFQAWDRNLDTQWTENGLPAWTVYSYNFDRVEWINRITVASSNDADRGRDPVKINMYGSDDGINWNTLLTVEKKQMFDRPRQQVSFMMMNHMTSYGKFKFEIEKSKNGVAQTTISFLALEACKLTYCTKDGDYPGTLSGQEVIINCSEGFIGERYRKCGTAELKPEWMPADETECISKVPDTKGKSFVDTALVISPISRIDMMEKGSSALATSISNYLSKDIKVVEVWKVKDVSDIFQSEAMGDSVKTAVWIRVTTDDADAADVLKKMAASTSVIQENVRSYYSDIFTKDAMVDFFMKPELNQYKGYNKISGWYIFLMIVVVLIIVAIVSFFIWTRMKNKKSKNGSKQLARAKGGKKVKKATDSKKAQI